MGSIFQQLTIRTDRDLYRFAVALQSNAACVEFTLTSDITAVTCGERLSLFIHPKAMLKLESCIITATRNYHPDERLMINGYQSWSESREYRIDERLPGLRPLFKPVTRRYHLADYGDEYFYPYPAKPGVLHSHTYTYIRRGTQAEWLGSLSEKEGFTIFEHDTRQKTLTIRKDCARLEIDQSYRLFDLFIGYGAVETIATEYFDSMGIPRPRATAACGWTSWYRYYTGISETIILENLHAFQERQIPLDFFQIDDGYQQAIGDWLVLMQLLFYLFLTIYVTPYFALLPELGHTAEERLNLSTWISITYALGIILASQVPLLAEVLQRSLVLGGKVPALQLTIGLIALVAALFMFFPVWFIDEKTYCQSGRAEIPLREALRRTFHNRHFIYYVAADFTYFMGLTIIMTGLLYYITVLLRLEAALMGVLLPLLVIASFLFYPLVNVLAKKTGKKVLVVVSFLFMSGIFLMIYFLGRLPLDSQLQAYLIVFCFALPLSFLGILPNAILADIAEHDALASGIKQEGMFFAARTLMQKFGQTFGVLLFAALTTLGKDPGHDLGVRLSGLCGALLCLLAGLYFLRYNEKQVLEETEVFFRNEMQAERE